MPAIPDALRSWMEQEGPATLLATIRARAERGYSTERGDVRCELSANERRQVGRLLGTPWQLSGRPVRLQDLAARLST